MRFHLKSATEKDREIFPLVLLILMKLLDSAWFLLYLLVTFSFLSHTCLISFCVSAQLVPCLTSLLSECDTYLTSPRRLENWQNSLAAILRETVRFACISIVMHRYCFESPGKPGRYVKYLRISISRAPPQWNLSTQQVAFCLLAAFPSISDPPAATRQEA